MSKIKIKIFSKIPSFLLGMKIKSHSSENMGNCCSSKRANGYDSDSIEDSQSLKETLNGNSHNHHHHHHHHHHHKRHSSSTTELTLINDQNNNNHHHHNSNSNNSSNSMTSHLVGNTGNKRNSKNKFLLDEEREDLIPQSSNSLISTNQTTSPQNSMDSYESLYPKTISSSNGVIASNHGVPNGGLSYSYPTHTRQLSTEKVGNCGPQFKTPLSSIPQHMRMEGFQRTKHNSTSSLYIKSTLSTPDNDEILRCMANALLYHIEKGTATPQKMIEIFSEEKYPITKGKLDLKSLPSVDTIYKFIRDIFKAERLDSECAIMCLAYIERIITFTGATLNACTWRRIVLSALILASKVWEDQSVWNVDFLPVFDNLTAADLNNLERQFLALLQYNVSLTASIYAKYYFELRTFSQLDSAHFPLNPLDKEGVKRLEDHSKASEYRVKPFKRSASVDQINPHETHNRAVIN
ncbi:cyclin domain-containing protein [Tieghemostelium lacteum]|uniref:Cyclin domain-containing protein n=1 Tax=Tieghemostelium lacteum TaxID=361077 RepID=A0A151ZFV2_TIELA|nr:cyclin domain-containing protein [Tieghemostelium lacteum]|eukprot:KYQ92846.1 cyclin domain-containing protein [Tieghemostelium lacteum]